MGSEISLICHVESKDDNCQLTHFSGWNRNTLFHSISSLLTAPFTLHKQCNIWSDAGLTFSPSSGVKATLIDGPIHNGLGSGREIDGTFEAEGMRGQPVLRYRLHSCKMFHCTQMPKKDFLICQVNHALVSRGIRKCHSCKDVSP